MPVAEDLDLDVPGHPDEPLQVQPPVTECGGGLRPGCGPAGTERGLVLDHRHAAAAAARSRLDQDRVAELVRGGYGRLDVAEHRRAVQGGQAGPVGQLAGPGLVSGLGHHVRARPDEGQARVHAGRGEGGVLRQEAVTGVDRVAAGAQGRAQHRVDGQVALRRGRRPDAHGPAGQPGGQGVPVGGGGHHHRFQTGLLAGPDDADRDLAPVGDQDPAQRPAARAGRGGRGSGRRAGGAGAWPVAHVQPSERLISPTGIRYHDRSSVRAAITTQTDERSRRSVLPWLA